MNAYYDFLDNQINSILNATVGFNNLLGSSLFHLDPDIIQDFFNRYHLIKEFQQTTLSLFKASLHGEFNSQLASLIINELPHHQGWEYHKDLTSQQHRTPVFFRTDETAPGKITEIQCPGSLWGLCEQLYHLYAHEEQAFGRSRFFPQSLSHGFSAALKRYLGEPPVLHHLLDNASIPHDMRFFIQMTRKHDLKYFGYDKDITPYKCNFIRSHAFAGLLSDNFAKRRLADCNDGVLHYDLPPSILFDQKMSLIFPFWKETMSCYTDEIRSIFPYTSLITPNGFYLKDGEKIRIEDFLKLPRGKRNYYIKYAGCDLSLNWGSKGVYFAGALSQTQGRKLFEDIVSGFEKKKYWIIQEGYEDPHTASFFTRDGDLMSVDVHTKTSGFYGPNGLMGILVMQRPFYKVHGSTETILSICK